MTETGPITRDARWRGPKPADHSLSLFCSCNVLLCPVTSGVCNSKLGRVMHSIHRSAALAAFIFVLFLTVTAAPAQDRRQNQAGEFDFYVLALSWSPSYCEAAAERSAGRAPAGQCGERPYSFVVHGLWPQYEKGFPNIASSRRRSSTALWFRPCSI
jgi:ribonuclease I